jgi:dynamin 1-like protein
LHDSERPPSLPEKQAKARAILARTNAASLVSHEQVAPKPSPVPQEKAGNPSSSGSGSTWGISSIFSSSETRQPLNGSSKEHVPIRSYAEPAQVPLESSFSSIQLREPPATLRANDTHGEQETVEIAVTRLLLKSYYDIVRKNIQDLVPKAIMHFLVNHVKRELHSVFIRKLYRENLFEEMLQEKEEIAVKRKRCKEILRVLQQAAWTLEELPLEFESASRSSSSFDSTGLPSPATRGSAMTPALYALINGDYAGAQSASGYLGAPRQSKSKRSFSVEHSAAANGGMP